MPNSNLYQATWFAMGTEWQLQLCSAQPEDYLRSVAEAIEAEVEEIEQLLSFYRDNSDLAELNATASFGSVRVDPRLFALIRDAAALSEATGGAFDPTIAPLLRAWGFVGNTGAMPTPREIESARRVVGISNVTLDVDGGAVRYNLPGVALEFGAIGKGFAIDRCITLLREQYEIESALIHGGGSTIFGLGAPPESTGWDVAVRRPYGAPEESLATLRLHDRAVSVSAPHGKWFEQNGKRYGHVLDPRTGYPAAGCVAAVVATQSAMESDALSTAALVLGAEGPAVITAFRPDALVLAAVHEGAEGIHIVRAGE